MKRALGFLLLALCAAAPVAAQVRPAVQRPPQTQAQADTLSAEERALARLRALRGVAEPDTAGEAQDTLRRGPQTVQISGRGAAAPGGISRDSVMQALLTLRGYVSTEYKGDTAFYRADSSRLELRGNPQVMREGNQLVAKDLIIYDQGRAYACGYGEPVLTTPQMANPVASDTICYFVERHLGHARGARTTVSEGVNWEMHLDNMYFDARTNDVYSFGGRFTDCDLPWEHKHYYFGAKEVKVVRNNVMVARNVTLSFQDVPVFWLPFMVQSLSRGRRSGILMPRFGINDIARNSARYSRRISDVGFYFAINDYMGSEVAVDWFSDNWTALRGSLDYRFLRQFLNGGLTYRYFWKEEGGRDFTLSTQNSWQPNERTSLNLTANYATSTSFIRNRTIDPRELNQSINSSAGMRRRFDWGSFSVDATRQQHVTNDVVDMKLPAVNLSISPITLFNAQPGEERWFSNATWQAGGRMQIDHRSVGPENRSLQSQSQRALTSGANSSITMGRFSVSQNLDFNEQRRDRRDFAGDTIPSLPSFHEQRGRWSTSLSFQQPLIGTSSFSPSVSLNGQFVRSDSSEHSVVMSPTRVDFSAGLRSDVYGFWPGVGPFERFRHRLSPSFTYTYSPEVTADSLQKRLFSGAVGAAERNTLSIGLSQTFEAKFRSDAPEAVAEVEDTATGPRRRQQTAPITLLSISTDAIVYDFVEAREGYGLQTMQIGNSITSDLLRGLQLSFRHDLFRTLDPPAPGARAPREFAPHLSAVNASFSLNGDSWLFRLLRLGRSDSLPATREGAEPMQTGDAFGAGPAVEGSQGEFGLVGTGRRGPGTAQRGAVGSWSGNFNYTLTRPRGDRPGQRENQMLNANFRFQPTEFWSVSWNTGYSFTTKDFTDHTLTLSRRLHDWDANFDFVKAQNGNFAFQFRVALRANPDIKVDYSQSDLPSLGQRSF